MSDICESSGTPLTKEELRRYISRRIAVLPGRERRDSSICVFLGTFIASRKPGSVFSYTPFRDEVNIEQLNRRLAESGVPLFRPAVSGETMAFVSPDNTPLVYPAVVLTPLRAMGRNGDRLGRGGGFYDRFFAASGTKITAVGVGYTVQIIEKIPCEPHDRRVDYICSEDGICAV